MMLTHQCQYKQVASDLSRMMEIDLYQESIYIKPMFLTGNNYWAIVAAVIQTGDPSQIFQTL